jgi:hypothetical protein
MTGYQWDDIDGERMPLTRCMCGETFVAWKGPIVGIYADSPTELPCCGRRVWFSQDVRVHQEWQNDVELRAAIQGILHEAEFSGIGIATTDRLAELVDALMKERDAWKQRALFDDVADRGYALKLWLCTLCDQVYPISHSPDCPNQPKEML